PPVIVALAGMMSGRAPVRAASMVLVGVLAVNVAIVAGSSAHNVLRKTRAIDAQLAEIGSLRAPLLVALGESHSRWPLLKGTGAQMVLLPGALPAGCRTTNLVGGFGVGSYRAQYCAAPAGPQS
ncbi:MAG: hypothetical protein ACXWK0_19500, partial [Caulobacteraceae bacterium]